MPKFFEGQRARATSTVRNDRNKQPLDPEAVIFKFKDPAGNVTVSTEGSRIGPGVYEEQITLHAAGTWWWRFEGLNANEEPIAVDEGALEVEASEFP